MKIPFSIEEFFDVFIRYNNAVWPVQWVFVMMAVSAVVMLMRRSPRASRLALLFLSVFWLWTGVVYHWVFFSSINPAAYPFGALSVMQGALFIYLAAGKTTAEARWSNDMGSVTGLGLILYALAIYPCISGGADIRRTLPDDNFYIRDPVDDAGGALVDIRHPGTLGACGIQCGALMHRLRGLRPARLGGGGSRHVGVCQFC